jgi:phosphoesterase RecJ-like protein
MKLLEAGVSPNEIADELESNLSAAVLRLWGLAMMRTTLFANGECAVYWLTSDDFVQTGTTKEATENLVNYLLRIKGVRLVALCSERPGPDGKPTGEVRVSIRARAPLNAREVAAAFGGGGHDLASGCVIRSSIEEAVSVLRNEMESHALRISADR